MSLDSFDEEELMSLSSPSLLPRPPELCQPLSEELEEPVFFMLPDEELPELPDDELPDDELP